jgi:PAS domain S-box-containing protein
MVENKHFQLNLKSLFIFGLINHLILVGWFFTFPLEIALLIVRIVALPYVTVFPLATMLIGGFMQGEQRRLIVEKNLAVSEKLYRDLINTFNEGVLFLDQDANTIFVNPKMAEMLACEEDRIIGKPIYDFISKKDQAAFRKIIKNRQQDSKGQYELRLKRCDGKRLYTQVGFTHIFDDQGGYMGLLAGLQDITALKRSQDKMREQSRKLEEIVEERTRDLKGAQAQLIKAEKLASMGELAGNVGHELRNPLAVISNSIYLLKTLLEDADEQVKDYLLMIDKETQNASLIINDLLDYSRIQSNPKEDLNLGELITEVLAKQVFPENIKTENKVAADIPLVRANSQQLEQILVNIFNNAVEAMQAGGTLRVSSRKYKNKLVLSISDTGVGIAKSDIKRMFKPLFTTKPRGIGLGLSITSKLAELNDINIRVKSTQGKGTTFSLDFLLMA